MSLIPQVKCSRCDRKYSGLRTKCPYCGTRRHSKSNRAMPSDNSTLKLIVGILLIVILIAAVVVLIITSGTDKNPTGNNPGGTNPGGTSNTVDRTDGNNPGGNGSNPNTGNDPNPNPNTGTDPNPSTGNDPNPNTGNTDPVDTPKPSVQSVEIYYLGKPIRWEDANHVKDVSGNRGQKYTFTLNIKPSGIDATAVWTSSDESIATVTQNGVVSALKVGKCNITATVDGISHTIIFRVVEPKN